MHLPIDETRPFAWPRWSRSCLSVLALLVLVAAARSVIIVDQAEAVYVTEFGRSVRLIDKPGLHWKWPYQEPPRLRQAAPARFSTAARNADEGQKEPRSRLVRKLAHHRCRKISAIGPHPARRLGAGLRTWRLRSWRPKFGGHDLAGLVRVDRSSALDAIDGRRHRSRRRAGEKGYGLQVGRRPAPPAQLPGRRSVPRSSSRSGASGRRWRRRPGPRGKQGSHDPGAADLERQDGRRSRRPKPREWSARRRRRPPGSRMPRHAADPAFYQFLKTLETYRALLDNKTTLVLSAESDFLRLLTRGWPTRLLRPPWHREEKGRSIPATAPESEPGRSPNRCRAPASEATP